MQFLPSYDSQFITLFESGEGYVRRHIAVDIHASDYSYLEVIAIEKARMGKKVDMMPELLENDPLRAVVFYGTERITNPDLKIDGVLWEVEGSTNSKNLNNLKHAVDEGSKQANHVLINLSAEIPTQLMFRVVVGRFKDHHTLKAIEFRYNGTYTIFYK